MSYLNTYPKRIGPMIMYTKFEQNQIKTVGGVGFLLKCWCTTTNDNGRSMIDKVSSELKTLTLSMPNISTLVWILNDLLGHYCSFPKNFNLVSTDRQTDNLIPVYLSFTRGHITLPKKNECDNCKYFNTMCFCICIQYFFSIGTSMKVYQPFYSVCRWYRCK